MVKLALKPDKSLDSEISDSESAYPRTEASFGAEGAAGGVIGRDEWFEEPSLVVIERKAVRNVTFRHLSSVTFNSPNSLG